MMPTVHTVVRVLLASPGDVKRERDAVDEVVRELNATWTATSGPRLELIQWETTSRPGVSTDAQQVINEQLGDKWDIVLAIMWAHAGTKTPRAESGTIEEVRRALSRTRDADVRVMVYFKDAPIPPSQIDATQLEMVRQFQQELKGAGVLYRKFKELDEFRQLLRMHLSAEVQSFDSLSAASVRSLSAGQYVAELQPSIDAEELLSVEEDEGFLDLIELATDGMTSATAVVERLNASTQELGDKVNEAAEALRNAADEPQGQNVRRIKNTVNRTAADVERFATQVFADLPTFEKSYEQAMDAYGRAAILLRDFHEHDDDARGQLQSSVDVLCGMHASMTGARTQVRALRDAIERTPRITTRYNRARRHAVEALDGVCQESCRMSV